MNKIVEKLKKFLNYDLTSVNFYEGIKYFLLVFLILIYPFIIKLNIIPLNDSRLIAVETKYAQQDFFTYYKAYFLYAFAIIFLVFLLFYRNKISNLNSKIYLIFILLYMALTIISFAFSKYKDTALFGLDKQYEGAISILCYNLIFIFALLYIKVKDIKKISTVISISVLIMAVIGYFEFFDIFILDSSIFSKAIFGNYYPTINSIRMDTKMQLTIGGSNVVGEYMALFITLLFGFILYDFPSKSKKLVITYTAYYLLLFSLVLCGSKGGIIGGLIGIISNLFIFRKNIKENIKKVSILISSTLIIMLLLFPYSATGNVMERMSSEKDDLTEANNSKWLLDIKSENKSLLIKTVDCNINIKKENNVLYIYLNGKLKSYDKKYDDKKEYEKYVIRDHNLAKKLKINQGKNLNSDKVLLITYKKLRLVLNDDLEVVNCLGEKVNYNKIPHIEVGKYGKLLTKRVYLWSRIAPIIIKNPIFGIGPNCLIYEYPQYDYIGQMEYLNSNTYYLTLCHNHFIQVALSQGLPALIVYLVFLGLFFFYHRPKKIESEEAHIFYCFACAVFGYLVSTLVMDSSISVAPLAWLCIGMGTVAKESCFNYKKNKLEEL